MTRATPPSTADDGDAAVGRRSLTHGASFAAISFGSSAVLATISSIVTARIYGVEILGEFALAIAPAGLLTVLSTVREQPALVRRIAPLPPRHGDVTAVFLAVVTFSFALTLATAIPVAIGTWIMFRGPIGQPQLFLPAMVYLGGYVLFSNTSWNIDSVFAAFGDGRRLFLVRLHETLMVLVLVIALSSHVSVWSPVIAGVAAWGTALIHRTFAVRAWMAFTTTRAAVSRGFSELPDIIRFGLKMTPGSLATGLNTQSATWVLGAIAPVAVVGAYNRAWTISSRLVDVNWRLGEIVFPALVERHTRDDMHAFNKAYVTALRHAVSGLLVLTSAGAGAATAIMAVFGPGFDSAAPALAITLIVPVLTTVATLQSVGLLAIGLPGATSRVAVVAAACTFALTLTLTPPLGVVGPAIALVLGGVLGNVLSYRIARARLAPPFRELWPYRQRLAVIGAAIVGFVTARAVSDALPSHLDLVGLPVGAIAYAAMFVACGGLLPDDKQRLSWLMARLRAGRRRTTSPSVEDGV